MKNDETPPDKGYSTDMRHEEEHKMRRLRHIVDATALVIAQGDISVLEACALARLARRQALTLFPDKENVFDLIYRPRFARIISERLSNSPTWMN